MTARLGAATDVQSAARALVTAENAVASSSAQGKQTLDNAQAAVTDALNTQTVTLMKDQQSIVTCAAAARDGPDQLPVDARVERGVGVAGDSE